MNESVDATVSKPFLVRLGLWGVKSRRVALAFMWTCVALLVISAALQVWNGLAFGVAALWYGYAVRWMDKNSGW